MKFDFIITNNSLFAGIFEVSVNVRLTMLWTNPNRSACERERARRFYVTREEKKHTKILSHLHETRIEPVPAYRIHVTHRKYIHQTDCICKEYWFSCEQQANSLFSMMTGMTHEIRAMMTLHQFSFYYA